MKTTFKTAILATLTAYDAMFVAGLAVYLLFFLPA
jgi:hypothetical protein